MISGSVSIDNESEIPRKEISTSEKLKKLDDAATMIYR